MRMGRDRALLAAVGVATAIAVALYAPAMFGGKVLGGEAIMYANPPFSAESPGDLDELTNRLVNDSVFLYHPYQLFARDQVRGGELPLWNPDVGAGRPLGAGQGAPFFPLTWLSYLFPFWGSLAWIAALKMVLAAVGTFLFCRRLGARAAAAILGGISFAFGTYLLGLLDAGQALALLVMPWSLWLVDRLVTRRRAADAVGLGIATGLVMLNGHPESAALVVATILAYALFRLWTYTPRDQRSRILAMLTGAGALAIAVGAVAVVSTLQVIAEAETTTRGGNDRSLRILAGLFFPGYWGRDDTIAFDEAPTNFADRALYVGVLPLAVAIGALRLRGARDQLFFAVLAALGLALAVDTPLRELVQVLPGGDVVELGHLNGIVSFALAVLAALGIERMCAAEGAERAMLLRRVAIVAALPALAFAFDLEPGAARDALDPSAILGNDAPTLAAAKLASVARWVAVAAIGLGVLWWLLRRPQWGAGVAVAVVAVTAVDVALMDRGYRPMIDDDLADPPAPASIGFLQEEAGPDRVAGEQGSLFPDLASRFGIRDARVEDLPALERYVDLFQGLGGDYFEAFGSTTLDAHDPGALRLLKAFGVRHVLAGFEQRPPPAGFELALDEPGQLVYEVGDPVPRALAVHDWVSVDSSQDALERIRAVPLRRLGAVPAIEGAAQPPPRPGAAPSPVSVVRDEPDRVDLEVDMRSAGYVVLRDAYYPGWSATVDGDDAEILPADVGFRAVAVGAGRHRIGFEYRPVPVIAAVGVSGLALVAATIALVVIGIRARRLPRPVSDRG